VRPVTIPALREWVASNGTFSLGRGSRIAVSPRHLDELRSEADLLAVELELPVVSGKPREGDVHLGLGAVDGPLGREGYELKVGEWVEVRAAAKAGVFYGTRTLLQLLRHGPEVPRGRARDWPRYPERGLTLANGDYYLPGFLEEQIRELAHLKLNYLHLHFADYRWQVESERHPEIGAGEGVRLTQEQLRRVVALAERHHVTVVPEVDMPGHMAAALAPYPELRLEDASGERMDDKLDFTNPAAVRFARELMEEYLPLFPGPYWHAGADEFLPDRGRPALPKLVAFARDRYGADATAVDALIGFLNELNGFLGRRGKELRVWNDQLGGGGQVALDREVIVELWTDEATHGGPDPPSPQALLDDGHRVMNTGWFPTYLVPPGPRRELVDIARGYEAWEVNQFYGGETSQPPAGSPRTVASDEPRNLGSKLNVWWDAGPGEVGPLIQPRLRVIAQKTWGSPPPVATYDELQRLGDELSATT
jgi:hexosaminidase